VDLMVDVSDAVDPATPLWSHMEGPDPQVDRMPLNVTNATDNRYGRRLGVDHGAPADLARDCGQFQFRRAVDFARPATGLAKQEAQAIDQENVWNL